MIASGNLALRFLLEVGALVALGDWGFHAGRGLAVRVALGIGAPLVAAVLWGAFGAPRAPWRVHGVARLMLELLIFGGATAGLAAAGRPGWAAVFGAAAVVNRALMEVWGQ